jgi:hypothetical protein
MESSLSPRTIFAAQSDVHVLLTKETFSESYLNHILVMPDKALFVEQILPIVIFKIVPIIGLLIIRRQGDCPIL